MHLIIFQLKREMNDEIAKQQKRLRLKLLRSCIREALIHVGCDFPISDVIRNSDSEIPEGLIQLSDQVKWYTIVPVFIF
jgi:hypothetical protein